MCWRALALALFVALPAAVLAEEPAAIATTPVSGLVEDAAERMGPVLGEPGVEVEEASAGLRRRAALLRLRESLAPLEDPACVRVLATLGRPLFDWDAFAARVGPLWPEAYPAVDEKGELLVPQRLPPQDKADLELLSISGVLPLEVAISGEWARAVGVRHAGPPLAAAPLRAARAARLEGLARFAGVLLVVRGGGVAPAELGTVLLRLDQDRVSWPRAALLDAAGSPLERALLESSFEDGLRFMAYHYLRGGEPAMIAAMERPLVDPAELMRPGARRGRPGDLPKGCSFGPRGVAALLTGRSDAPWADGLLADRFVTRSDGAPRGLLVFESESAAGNAAAALAKLGLETVPEGPRLHFLLVPAP